MSSGQRRGRTAELRYYVRIELLDPEIICLTETDIRLLGDNGHTIYSRPDQVQDGRKPVGKALLWSREPWRQVDDVGAQAMPPGRFVSAVTSTSVGDVTVIGVCIPWHGSRNALYRRRCKAQGVGRPQAILGTLT